MGKASTGEETVLEKGKTTGSQLVRRIHNGKDKPLEIKNRTLASREEADDMAKAELNQASDTLVTSSGTIIGTPTLIPGQILEVKGVGVKFSGKYIVTDVTNRINGNGYTTTFNARKNVI